MKCTKDMRIIKKVISEKCKTVEEMFDNNPITIANVLGVINDGILMASRSGRCGNQSWQVEKVNNSFLHLRNVITGDKYDVYLLHLDSYRAEARFRKVKEKPDFSWTEGISAECIQMMHDMEKIYGKHCWQHDELRKEYKKLLENADYVEKTESKEGKITDSFVGIIHENKQEEK